MFSSPMFGMCFSAFAPSFWRLTHQRVHFDLCCLLWQVSLTRRKIKKWLYFLFIQESQTIRNTFLQLPIALALTPHHTTWLFFGFKFSFKIKLKLFVWAIEQRLLCTNPCLIVWFINFEKQHQKYFVLCKTWGCFKSCPGFALKMSWNKTTTQFCSFEPREVTSRGPRNAFNTYYSITMHGQWAHTNNTIFDYQNFGKV